MNASVGQQSVSSPFVERVDDGVAGEAGGSPPGRGIVVAVDGVSTRLLVNPKSLSGIGNVEGVDKTVEHKGANHSGRVNFEKVSFTFIDVEMPIQTPQGGTVWYLPRNDSSIIDCYCNGSIIDVTPRE